MAGKKGWLWFAGLYLAGVAVLTLAGSLIRLLLTGI